jgi:hypothetical protein
MKYLALVLLFSCVSQKSVNDKRFDDFMKTLSAQPIATTENCKGVRVYHVEIKCDSSGCIRFIIQ